MIPRCYFPCYFRCGSVAAILAVLISTATDGSEPPPSPAPQPQSALPQMIDIEWSAGPPMPQGMQDNDGGVIDDFLVMVAGFCHGIDDDWKPGKYPRGFLRKGWALNFKEEAAGWNPVPDLPGAARQEMYGLSVNNEIYLWGGFSYTEPYCYRDGYKLARPGGEWTWSELPPLLRPGSAGTIVAVDSVIYLLGGMDYDAQRYYVANDRHGKTERYGSRLYRFETERPEKGWKEVAPCPGTPRMMAAGGVIDGKVYIMGGFAVDDAGRSHNVVDCWRYDPEADHWERLRDTPVSVSGYSTGTIVYQNRYMLLLTGYPHGTILNPDGTSRPRYGTPSKIDRTDWKGHPKVPADGYENHAWVYDAHTNLYGTATYLPFDDHGQTSHIIGDTLYMFPGETSGFWWEDEYFGHAAEFVLKGKLKVRND